MVILYIVPISYLVDFHGQGYLPDKNHILRPLLNDLWPKKILIKIVPWKRMPNKAAQS